jgi:hypothetical protein
VRRLAAACSGGGKRSECDGADCERSKRRHESGTAKTAPR